MTQHPKNRTSIQIYGKTYVMVGNEEPEQMHLIAELVDEKMQKIKIANPVLDRTQLAVLTAVNTMNELMKTKEQLAEAEKQLKKLKDEANG